MRALVALAGFAALALANPDERDETFRWFDGLGYPDLAKAPFVRIYCGGWQRWGDNDPEPMPEYGFLLSDDGKAFRVFTVGLETLTCVRTRPGTPAHEQVRYDKVPLDAYVRGGLHRLANPPEDEWPWEFEPFGHRQWIPNQWFRILVFARACALQGHDELARELWDLAGKEGGFGGTTLDRMKQQFASEALYLLTIQFSNPDVTWADLLARCVSWKEKFGASEWIDETVLRLRQIVAETKEPDDPVRRLIRLLRDTPCQCFYFECGISEGPGQELARMGVAAAATLIEAWDDPTPSRCVQFSETGKGYLRSVPTVLAVGAQVRAIVGAIAGADLPTRADAEAWLKDVGARGEQAVLTDAVAAAGADAPARARLLLERYPDAAEAAILAGIARAQDAGVRSRLVWALRQVTTERTAAFLLDELKSQETQRRVDAAWLLLLRGRGEGVEAVAASWRQEGGESGAEFLIACGSSKAIQALEAGFLTKRVGARLDIAASFLHERGWGPVPEKELPPPDAEWPQAVEALLVHALADGEEVRGMTASWNDVCFTDPRVCDVAACALARRFPDRYDFDHRASTARRNARILECRNRWRQARGLPLLPIPKDARPPPLPPELEAELRRRFFEERNPATIEEHGLAALPAVTRWLGELAKDHEARPSLEELRRRLACTVYLLEAPQEARTAADSLRGRPLTAEALVGVAVSLANQLPQGATGFRIEAQRDEEGGTTLRLVLERGNGRPGSGWNYGYALRAGGRGVLSTSGACTDERGRSRACWEDLEKKLSAVLAGDPAVPFEARLSTSLDE